MENRKLANSLIEQYLYSINEFFFHNFRFKSIHLLYTIIM